MYSLALCFVGEVTVMAVVQCVHTHVRERDKTYAVVLLNPEPGDTARILYFTKFTVGRYLAKKENENGRAAKLGDTC